MSKNELRKQFGLSADKTYQQDFLKATVLHYSAKGARPAPFVEHSGHSLVSATSEQTKIDKQIALITNSSYQ